MKLLSLMATFTAVVENGSFTAAAEDLKLSKSYISKQVSQLEQALNTQLLHRTTRRLSLSEEGIRFYQHCQQILQQAENACTEALESQNSPKGKIRFTLPQSLVIAGFDHLFLQFQQDYPDIELDLMVSGQAVDLIEAGVDIALRLGQLEDSNLMARPLMQSRFIVAATPGYLQRSGIPQQPKDLTQHNCLIYGDSRLHQGWPFVGRNAERTLVRVKGSLISNDGLLVINQLLAGQGIGFGPDFLYQPYIEQGKLQTVLSDYALPSSSLWALYPNNRQLPRRVRLLIDFLATELSANDMSHQPSFQ